MAYNKLVNITEGIKLLLSIKEAEEIFEKELKIVEEHYSGIDLGEIADKFYDHLDAAKKEANQVLCKLIDIQVNQHPDK